MKPIRPAVLVALAVTVIANLALLGHYHDRFWWPADDGFHAQVAERMAGGEVLDRDIEENHPGYINFIHLAAFRLFGADFVSLRYPLAAAAFLQGLLTFALLATGARWLNATLAALGATILGVLQFLSPQSHWYCALVAVALAAAFTFAPRQSRWRLPVVGFLVAVEVLLRQLTGVFMFAAVVTLLLAEKGAAITGAQKLAARAVLAVLMLALGAYQLATADLVGFALVGVWPLVLLAAVIVRTTISNREVARLAGPLALGAMAAALPLLLYHVAHGSLRWWFEDTVVRALGVVDLPYLKLARYWHLFVVGLAGLLSGGGVARALNGVYWCLLPLVGIAVGVATLHRYRKRGDLIPLAVIAVFYALVALFNQIPIYLLYTAALTLAALLCLGATERWRPLALGLAAFLLPVALHFHAAQPLLRGIQGTIAGQRIQLVPSGLDKCSLWIDPRDRQTYAALVDLIRAHSTPGQPIFVFPNNADLYFLTDRKNPFRFYNTALGVTAPAQAREVLTQLLTIRPPLVIHAADDKSNTPLSVWLVHQLAPHYQRQQRIGGFDVYRPVGSP